MMAPNKFLSNQIKHMYTLAKNLVTLKYQCLNGNNSVISESVMKLFYHFGMKWT
jgi:hypothetical protein